MASRRKYKYIAVSVAFAAACLLAIFVYNSRHGSVSFLRGENSKMEDYSAEFIAFCEQVEQLEPLNLLEKYKVSEPEEVYSFDWQTVDGENIPTTLESQTGNTRYVNFTEKDLTKGGDKVVNSPHVNTLKQAYEKLYGNTKKSLQNGFHVAPGSSKHMRTLLYVTDHMLAVRIGDLFGMINRQGNERICLLMIGDYNVLDEEEMTMIRFYLFRMTPDGINLHGHGADKQVEIIIGQNGKLEQGGFTRDPKSGFFRQQRFREVKIPDNSTEKPVG